MDDLKKAIEAAGSELRETYGWNLDDDDCKHVIETLFAKVVLKHVAPAIGPAAVGSVERAVRPVAEIAGGVLRWRIPAPEYRLAQQYLRGTHMLYDQAAINGAVAAERERCAMKLHVTRADVQLAAGELTAQEWRTCAAVLRWMQGRIRGPND